MTPTQTRRTDVFGWTSVFGWTCGAQALAVLGEHVLLMTALPLWAFARTHSARGVSLALLAVAVPALFSFPAGVWAARRSPRAILLGAGLLRLLLVLSLLLPALPVPLVLALVAGIGLADSFFMPALKAAVPDWVAPGRLLAANGWLEATDIPAQLLGPPLAVALYAAVGFTGPVLAQAAAYAAALLLLLVARLPRSPHPVVADARPPRGLSALREAFGLARRLPAVSQTLMALTIGMVAAGIADTLALPYLRQALGQPVRVYGLFGTLLGVGMAAGAGLSAVWEPPAPRCRVLAWAAALAAFALGLLAISHALWLSGAAWLLGGAAFVWVQITAVAILQEAPPPPARAGVLGLSHTLEAAGLLVGVAFAGQAAGNFGLRPTLGFAAALLLIAAGVFGLRGVGEGARSGPPPGGEAVFTRRRPP